MASGRLHMDRIMAVCELWPSARVRSTYSLPSHWLPLFLSCARHTALTALSNTASRVSSLNSPRILLYTTSGTQKPSQASPNAERGDARPAWLS